MDWNCPVSQTRLRQISNDACDAALAPATAYEHTHTQKWNDEIINGVLRSLVSESQTAAPDAKFKFCVNSTIIQHLSDPRSVGSTSRGVGSVDDEKTAGDAAVEGEEELKREVEGAEEGKVGRGPGRRGMHSASGAYWNNSKDGMWSTKWEGGEDKGMDIVVAIMWIAV